MKFPRSVRSSGASLLVAVSLLLSSIVSAQRPARNPPAPPAPRTPSDTTAAANEKTPAATFDTLLSADAYGVYAELRMVGRQAGSQELAQLLTPLTLSGVGGAPDELLNFYEFLKTHAEPLMTARLMFAAMPVRAGLPESLVAVEMPSVEEAQKFLPEVKQFIAVNFAPQPRVADTAVVADASTRTEDTTVTNNRRGRRRARERGAKGNARAEAAKPPAAPPVQIKRSGSIIAMSGESFTFKNLRGGRDQALLVNEPGFQAARTRFGTDSLFIYFNTTRMSSSSKLRMEAYEKEHQRQVELARVESEKQVAASNLNMSRGSMGDGNMSGNTNNANTNAPPSIEDEPPAPLETPEPTPSPKSEKELEEERQREQSRQFAQTVGSLVFGDGPRGNSTSAWPESIGVGVSFEADALVARALFISLTDDQPLRPVPFLPVVLSGPSIATEAPGVLPAETDIFLTMSLDLPQMYDYLASMMKILDLAATASGEGKGGLAEQLTSFEKTNNFRIKEELLAALGNEIAIGLPSQFLGVRSGKTKSADDASDAPALSGPIAVIALNDKKALQELLPRVLASVGFVGATEQSIIEKHGEVEVLNFSGGTLAFIDRFLVSAPDAAAMHRIIDAYNSGETLANNQRFRDSTGWQARQAIGQAYVSNTLLKSMFEDVSKSVADIDEEAMRAYLLQLDPDPGSITLSATRESDGLMHELHLPKNFLSLLSASSVIGQKLSTLRSNESTAQWKLRMIHGAQGEYKVGKGRYGTLEELKAAGQLNEEHQTLEMEGYEIKLSVSGDGFEATATPTGYPKQGRRSFYIDAAGELRGGDKGGKLASVSDPIIDF
ncbi:MAG TPA: DUF3352 domain-containing protein [Pyrinomonadaceae bacterium]|jgi:hypothetical protein